jgi:hypothetical protein
VNFPKAFIENEINCVVANITDNLVDTFNGMVLRYDNADHVASADYRRSRDEFEEYPQIVPQFIEATPLKESSGGTHYKLRYLVSCYVADEPDREGYDPISKTLRNVGGLMIKEVMKDISRGGNAIKTDVGEFGEYFHDFDIHIEYVVWVELFVHVFMDTNDPFVRVG